MLVFADESGDPGPAIGAGGSPYFTVAVVQFSDAVEAQRCEALFARLRTRLNLGSRAEFHFRADSHERRLAFLHTLAEANFLVAAATIDKSRVRPRPSFSAACIHALEVLPFLEDFSIVFDASGGRVGQKLVVADLRAHFGERLKNARASRSQSDSLVQLADYVAGIANRVAGGARGGEQYLAALGAKVQSFERLP